jgi:hypothetical protein
MSEPKNNKLRCIITGRQLIATKKYYARKVEKAGSEEVLHSTYVCREAKSLLRQGVSVDRIREILDSDVKNEISEEVLNKILEDDTGTRLRHINNIIKTNKSMSIKTDDSVKQFINKYIKSE